MTRFTLLPLVLALMLVAPSCKKDPPVVADAGVAVGVAPPLTAAATDTGPATAGTLVSEVVPVDAGPPRAPEPVKAGDLIATLDTSLGVITIRLFTDKAPLTVANFVGLADGTKEFKEPKSGQMAKRPFFDGLPFFSVAPSLVVQSGDPLADGTGDPGFTLPDEFHKALRHDRPGVVTMANRGKNTNGSQFMITLRPLPLLDDRNSIFGEVVSGMDVVEAISKVPTVKRRPQKDVVIKKVVVKKIA